LVVNISSCLCEQTLRYNASGAYVTHLDWVEGPGNSASSAAPATEGSGDSVGDADMDKDKDGKAQKGGKRSKSSKEHSSKKAPSDAAESGLPGGRHNYDSANSGTNRYATLLVYLNDAQEGGETVFSALPAAPAMAVAGTAAAAGKKGLVSAGASEGADVAPTAQQREVSCCHSL
jgi:hypothetical protein